MRDPQLLSHACKTAFRASSQRGTIAGMTKDCKDRIWMYSIWIAWGCSAIPIVWSDAIPSRGALTFSAWLGGFLFATWLTARHFRHSVVSAPAPNPDIPPESD